MEHASDCAVHNAPAYSPGPCDCGAEAAMTQNIEGLRDALDRIQKAAADTSRDGDARLLESQMSWIAGTAEDALKLWI